jgi:hypothetical protein
MTNEEIGKRFMLTMFNKGNFQDYSKNHWKELLIDSADLLGELQKLYESNLTQEVLEDLENTDY